MRKITAIYTFILLMVLFVGLVIINDVLFDSTRIDLTEQKVFTLSDGSHQIIDEIKEPVTLHFFFSEDATKGMTALRNYADRVKSLLREYEKAANGKIRLRIIDPEPFSEAEDKAARFGLTGATLGNNNDTVYFGLAGTNTLDDQITIGFFDPQKANFLEYDISKMLHQLSIGSSPKLALITGLPVQGGQNPVTGQNESSMVFYEQLSQLFDVHLISPEDTQLPEDTAVVMLAHPPRMSEALKYAIDQYAMAQGQVIAFVDPHYESDMLSLMGNQQANRSDMSLLKSWGVDIPPDTIVLDGTLGLEVQSASGGVVKHPGYMGLGSEQLHDDDVITANLDSVNIASAGEITLLPSSTLDMEVLMQTSDDGFVTETEYYLSHPDPQDLQQKLGPNGQVKIVAAHVTGTTISAFGQPPEGADRTQFKATTDKLNLLVISDADMLADRFWVQQNQFFGQTLYSPFANNGDFVVNAAENLAGSNALINVRSRGQFARPFSRVESLERRAQKQYREHEQKLRDELAQTESQLARLQNQQGQGTSLVLTDEQQRTIDAFVEKRVAIRKQLRDVQYELRSDIDKLGNWLKFVNIAAAPLVLVMTLYLLTLVLRRRAGSRFNRN